MSEEFQQRGNQEKIKEKLGQQPQQNKNNSLITSTLSLPEQPQINSSTKISTTMASENEDFIGVLSTTTTNVTTASTTGLQQQQPQLLQHQNSLSNSNNSTSFSMFSSRIDDEGFFKLKLKINII